MYIPAIHSPFLSIRKRQSSNSYIVGAQEETHNLTINGHKWLHQPGTPQDPTTNQQYSYRSQVAGISEHFEFLTGKESVLGNRPFIDYLYQNSASVDGQWNGV